MAKSKSKWQTDNYADLREYNATDVWNTLQLHHEMQSRAQNDVYERLYQPLLEPLLDMSLRGVKVDVQTLKREYITLNAQCQMIRQEMEEVAGKPFHTKKGLSVKKLTEYLYGDCGFRKLSSSPTDELALKLLRFVYGRKLADYDTTQVLPHQPLTLFTDAKKKVATEGDISNWRQGLQIVDLILKHREKFQASTFMQPARVDDDGRFRASYKFTTMFCRLSSSKNPFGTGANFQNVPHDAKHVFVPNELDHVILELDLSQSENRTLGCLTGDPDLIRNAKSDPNTFDVHKWNAAIIFRKPESEVTKEERQLAKKVVYGTNYFMQPPRMTDMLMKDEIFLPIPEVAKMMDAYLTGLPAIHKWQERTFAEAAQHKELVNSWGVRFSFLWDINLVGFDKHLKNRLLACRPQSDSGILLNQQGLLPSWHYIQKKLPTKAQLLLQVHDSLVFSVHKKNAYDLACFVKEHLEQPHDFYGTMLSIPTQIKVGPNYRDLEEIKDVKELKCD